MRRLILAFAVVNVLGCNAAAPNPQATGAAGAAVGTAPTTISTTTPATSSTPGPSASPVLLTIKQAATKYAAAAKTYNTALKTAGEKYGNRSSLKAQKRHWALLAKAEDKFIEAVKAIAFPADIQSDANKLTKAGIVAQRAALSASMSKTLAQLNVRAAEAYKRDLKAVDAAAVLRDDLDLPPNS